MTRTAALLAAAVIAAASWVAWLPATAYAKGGGGTLSASISCAPGTAGLGSVTPVNSSDVATGATLTLGCGQFGPSSATEATTGRTSSYNYGFDYYVIANSSVSGNCLGRTRIRSGVSCTYPDGSPAISFTAT